MDRLQEQILDILTNEIAPIDSCEGCSVDFYNAIEPLSQIAQDFTLKFEEWKRDNTTKIIKSTVTSRVGKFCLFKAKNKIYFTLPELITEFREKHYKP